MLKCRWGVRSRAPSFRTASRTISGVGPAEDGVSRLHLRRHDGINPTRQKKTQKYVRPSGAPCTAPAQRASPAAAGDSQGKATPCAGARPAPHRTAWPADVTLRQWACAARLSRPKLACAKRVWPVWCCRVGRICGGSGRRASSLGLEPWRWPRLRCAGVAHARLPESRAISYSAERRARVFVWYFR